VDAAKHHEGARGASRRADFVSAQRIAGMDADAYDITSAHRVRIDGSSVSSTKRGCPCRAGVAEARTYNHRGVMTPIPNET
jgi:hypothetical protein